MTAILAVSGTSIALGLLIAVSGMLTGSPDGRFTWPPKWPARYPAPPRHRAPKGLRDVEDVYCGPCGMFHRPPHCNAGLS